jgi:hypothetical protein
MPSPVLSEERGGHSYADGASYCKFDCGSYMGRLSAGRTNKRIDPFGLCPNNPKNTKGENKVKAVTAESLLNKDLKGFAIRRYVEIYRTDRDSNTGAKVESLGYLPDEDLAKAFSEIQKDSSDCKTKNVFLLTDGKAGLLLSGEPVKMLDVQEVTKQIKEAAMKEISPAKRKVLGLK